MQPVMQLMRRLTLELWSWVGRSGHRASTCDCVEFLYQSDESPCEMMSLQES